jgi:hypothetical protein
MMIYGIRTRRAREQEPAFVIVRDLYIIGGHDGLRAIAESLQSEMPA